MHPKIAYTVKEATAAIGISRTMLYALIKAGELTPVKIGARTLIRRPDLEAMIERKATRPIILRQQPMILPIPDRL